MTPILIASAKICSDFILATILTIIRRALDLIQLIVPIILIVSGSVQLVKMVMSPPEGGNNKANKKFLNSFLAAAIVFFLPLVVNISMNIINEYGEAGIADNGNLTVLDLSSCWTAAKYTQSEMDSVRDSGGSNSSTIRDEYVKTKIIGDTSNIPKPGDYQNSQTNPQNTEMGLKIVNYARQFLGRPYVWGGNSLTNGTDCSGYIHLVYANFGINVPRQSAEFRTFGTEVPSINEARAGDIICYNGHVALFVGDGLKIYHAKGKNYGIVEDQSPFYGSKQVLAIRRVVN